jgi:hypothetical protein
VNPNNGETYIPSVFVFVGNGMMCFFVIRFFYKG